MQTGSPFVCEAKVHEEWRGITLAEALGVHGSAAKRCLACHGSVSVHGGYGGQVPATVHRKGHDGCPRSPRTFNGTASPHPNALL
jgi:hypothetical protein